MEVRSHLAPHTPQHPSKGAQPDERRDLAFLFHHLLEYLDLKQVIVDLDHGYFSSTFSVVLLLEN